MTEADPEELARALSGESIARGDPSGWFERLYSAAEGGEAVVPWDRGAPHPLLVDWAETTRLDGGDRRSLVVGAGLGSDAELIAGLGFRTTAFDISPTAIQMALDRFPQSEVQYAVADLLDPPEEWRRAFDLVVEIITVQALPRSVRAEATAHVRDFVAPGGTLLVISTALGDGDDPNSGPPWPLTRTELEAFAGDELEVRHIDRFPHPDEPQIQRWRAEFTRPA